MLHISPISDEPCKSHTKCFQLCLSVYGSKLGALLGSSSLVLSASRGSQLNLSWSLATSHVFMQGGWLACLASCFSPVTHRTCSKLLSTLPPGKAWMADSVALIAWYSAGCSQCGHWCTLWNGDTLLYYFGCFDDHHCLGLGQPASWISSFGSASLSSVRSDESPVLRMTTWLGTHRLDTACLTGVSACATSPDHPMSIRPCFRPDCCPG